MQSLNYTIKNPSYSITILSLLAFKFAIQEEIELWHNIHFLYFACLAPPLTSPVYFISLRFLSPPLFLFFFLLLFSFPSSPSSLSYPPPFLPPSYIPPLWALILMLSTTEALRYCNKHLTCKQSVVCMIIMLLVRFGNFHDWYLIEFYISPYPSSTSVAMFYLSGTRDCLPILCK